MASAILSMIYISLQPVCIVSFDINMEFILKQSIRIGCVFFMSDFMKRFAFQAWPLYVKVRPAHPRRKIFEVVPRVSAIHDKEETGFLRNVCFDVYIISIKSKSDQD